MSHDRCPVCGGAVRIISDADGTNHYEPLSGDMEALRLEHADQLEAAVATCERLCLTAARLSRAVSTDADALQLAGQLAVAANRLLDVTVAASPHARLSAIARQIGALHQAWQAWDKEVTGGSSRA